MKRWSKQEGERVENAKIDEFLLEVIAVCKKHGFSINHEDMHGAFVIEDYDDAYDEWLKEAHTNTDAPG